jgi:hypothetical protein
LGLALHHPLISGVEVRAFSYLRRSDVEAVPSSSVFHLVWVIFSDKQIPNIGLMLGRSKGCLFVNSPDAGHFADESMIVMHHVTTPIGKHTGFLYRKNRGIDRDFVLVQFAEQAKDGLFIRACCGEYIEEDARVEVNRSWHSLPVQLL